MQVKISLQGFSKQEFLVKVTFNEPRVCGLNMLMHMS